MNRSRSSGLPLLTLALTLLFAPAARAADKVTIASCDAGGCRCRLAAVDAAEAALTAGIAPPPGPGATLVEANGTLAWSLLSPDEIDTVMGGDGKCELEMFDEMVPEDGIWREGPVTVESVQCGLGTAMFTSRLASQPRHTMRITWGGVFDGARYQAAAMAAAPDPEYSPHAFRQISPRQSIGTAEVADEGGALQSVGQLDLLDPRRFRMTWRVTARTEGGPCNWTISFPVEWVQP